MLRPERDENPVTRRFRARRLGFSSGQPASHCDRFRSFQAQAERLGLRFVFRPLDWAACCATMGVGIALSSAPARAQTSPPATDSTSWVSTLSGVYSEEQAKRGKDVYANLCKSCHNPSVGDAFAKRWAGKTLLD